MVGDHVLRFIQHLSPRYTSTFQSRTLSSFLTYDASTSMNMYLAALASPPTLAPLPGLVTSPPGTPAGGGGSLARGGPGSRKNSTASTSRKDSSSTLTLSVKEPAYNYAASFQAPMTPTTVTSFNITPIPSTPIPSTPGPGAMVGMGAGMGVGGNPAEAAALLKMINEGLGITDDQVVFSLTPSVFASQTQDDFSTSKPLSSSPPSSPSLNPNSTHQTQQEEDGPWRKEGDVLPVRPRCVDQALWEVGGAAVALRLVGLARGQHELSRTVGVLVDGVRFSWGVSEDVERMRRFHLVAPHFTPFSPNIRG